MMRRRAFMASAVSLIAITAAGCGGSSASPKKPGGPEKTSIKVGVLPTWDAAALYLGNREGYFKAEGLTVTPVVLTNGNEAISRTTSGALDISYDGYIPAIIAASKGVKMKFVADGSQAKPNMYVIVVPQKSNIHKPQDLAGKKIGVINSKGLPRLLTSAALQTSGVDPKSVTYVDIPYPNMGVALQRGSIDAAFATDPFLTRFQQSLGARVVLDTINGPTADFPIGVYHASDRFVKQNPKTVAAFQRAMSRAETFAASNRNEVATVLPTYIKGLTPQTAQTITLGTFSTTLSKTRIQRVADFLVQQKVISDHFDVQQLLQ